MNFTERLTEYREGLNLNKKEMASRLEVLPSAYTMVENGSRKPSKKFLYSLVADSGKPEEYWLYGISDEEYRKTRDIAKSTRTVIEQIKELKLVNDLDSLFKDYEPKNVAETLFIAAIKADLSYIIQPNEEDE
ncbi:helix-turn-helix transcriptional regulator [Clostridium tertium]|jgi:transcriptional regulator with XRE-family HTH domain|uniref:helix-turn-helix domain-containing protein n=1 Tax=Clostridium tertium TaxID=1559 RepID=UPI0023305AD9|nr:helix-turn-helix transcriptional regulator [Clostridium tertium]MDB1932953.1 helix-turn-helix transcriptional regulator [Clostridium tertium]MDB1938313.1 helix-turn-helix transcriptional regulator [Clostridium tertium]